MMWTLFWTFAKIGLFTIGGGQAMLPLIQQTLIENGWMTLSETIDMVAISQMTPGPFAVNAATFTGMRLYGFGGAVICTLGVMMPSLIIVNIVAHFFFRFQQSQVTQATLSAVRPVVPALIAASLWGIAKESLVFSGSTLLQSWPLILIAGISAVLMWRTKVNPAWLILAGAAIGAVLFR